MTKDDIISLPDKRLRRRSKKISIITDKIIKLAKNMQEATLDWEDSRPHEFGVALAAVQLGKLYRVVVIRNSFDDKSDRGFQVLINPKITKYEGAVVNDTEGCLSVKNVYGKVPRHQKVRVRALNLDGDEVKMKAEGFLARVLQHEVDHTNGVLFTDHVKHHHDFYQLNDNGQLEPMDEEEIRANHILRN